MSSWIRNLNVQSANVFTVKFLNGCLVNMCFVIHVFGHKLHEKKATVSV